MRLPSLSHIAAEASRTAKRFPFAIVAASVGTIATIMITHHEGQNEMRWLANIPFVAALGISSLMSCVLFGERNHWKTPTVLLAQCLCVLLLALYYWSLPVAAFDFTMVHGIRFALLLTGMHLLLAVIAFLRKDTVNGFWQFNKSLFLRFLTGALYSSVLFGGLALALKALDQLFGLTIDFKLYADLWLVIAGMFHTWFVLAGVPADFLALEGVTEYPRGLKFFTQFILLPIIAVYLVILYAYMGKILVTWSWPNGWVSGLILGFSITGIFSLLLVHPIKDLVENVWIRTIARWFYVVLVPLAIMMLLAVWRRASEYGITESRYIGLVVGAWLVGIALYFSLSRQKNIKFIPLTLCIIALTISFGPWGAFQTSIRSQIGRLQETLVKNDMLVDGKARKASRDVSFEDTKTIGSIVRYLCDVHSVGPLQQFFEEKLDSVTRLDSARISYTIRAEMPQKIVALMGIKYVTTWETNERTFRSFISNQAALVDLQGYTREIRLANLQTEGKREVMQAPEGEVSVSLKDTTLSVVVQSTDGGSDSIRLNLNRLIENLFSEYSASYATEIPAEKMTLVDSSSTLRVRVFFPSLVIRKADSLSVSCSTGPYVYIGRK